MAELSPMMHQYFDIKAKHPDSIVFFRLGDFYEMFFDDAEKVSKELDLVLTGRDCGQEERAPMCGVPHHSCDAYIARLIAKGYKIAVCEQVEDPKTAKGIVKRDVVRVITPGTVIEDNMLEEGKNNYLGAVTLMGKTAGICFVDPSTGSLNLTEVSGKDMVSQIISELGMYSPSELLLSSEAAKSSGITDFAREKMNCLVTEREPTTNLRDIITNHFKVNSITNLDIPDSEAVISALGNVLSYLYETQRIGLEGVNSVNFYTSAQYMRLDLTARRNLELVETMRGKERKGTLLWVLDKTRTAMGKRLIRTWIEQPLISAPLIDKRLNAVNELFSDTVMRGEVREALSGIYDLERIMTKVVFGTATPRELESLKYTLSKLPNVKEQLSQVKSAYLQNIYKEIDTLSDMRELIDSSIIENPPVSIKDGGIIKPGFNEEIDLLNADLSDGKNVITRVETAERERTGIPKLKVGYNRVFGYYIEVTNSYKEKVPPEYIRKQTLTNCERYITQELKELEQRVLGARERSVALEYEVFANIRNAVADKHVRFATTAAAIARLDVITSFAQVGSDNSYCRPDIYSDGRLDIKNGRHPVVEAMLKTPFVPNDTSMNLLDERCAIITGPNMAGKSTYMRQVALIALMAQIGSFVPAESAALGISDAVYTRVGASDDLSAGQSTFMVEMSEVAFILKNATRDSLIILDEIGRGTSTFDGMSIARAVLEHTVDKKKLGAKTLFATHYHELTALENELDGAKNYNIAVKKRGDDITFLRRIVRGGADDSYGIEVAKLAGVPNAVIGRAKEVLCEIESGTMNDVSLPERLVSDNDDAQISFGYTSNAVIDKLKTLDVNTLTPIEALGILHELSTQAEKY